jgi:hypothetical protein
MGCSRVRGLESPSSVELWILLPHFSVKIRDGQQYAIGPGGDEFFR